MLSVLRINRRFMKIMRSLYAKEANQQFNLTVVEEEEDTAAAPAASAGRRCPPTPPPSPPSCRRRAEVFGAPGFGRSRRRC